MTHHFTKRVSSTFDDTLARVGDELKKEGSGVLSTIDVQATLKAKLGVDFRRYTGRQRDPRQHRQGVRGRPQAVVARL